MSLGVVLAVVFSGLITGGLARLAIPGPDPMPLWLTLAIGLTGSIVGAVVARALFEDNGYVVSFGSLFVAMALVAAYRRFVQRRPVWGPEALKFPERGLGVAEYRERLEKLGVDPERLTPQVPPRGPQREPAPEREQSTDLLGMLDELHEAGVLDDDEWVVKRALVERQRGSAT